MHKANSNPENPAYERINFSQGANDGKLAASSVARGLQSAVGAGDHANRIEIIMAKIDLAMAKSNAKARGEHYLRLLGLISPTGTLPALVIRALGVVSSERWKDEIAMPSRKTIERLRSTPWASKVILQEKYFSILCDTVRKIWREKA